MVKKAAKNIAKNVKNEEVLNDVANALAIETAKIIVSRMELDAKTSPAEIAQNLFFAFFTAKQELRNSVPGAKKVILNC